MKTALIAIALLMLVSGCTKFSARSDIGKRKGYSGPINSNGAVTDEVLKAHAGKNIIYMQDAGSLVPSKRLTSKVELDLKGAIASRDPAAILKAAEGIFNSVGESVTGNDSRHREVLAVLNDESDMREFAAVFNGFNEVQQETRGTIERIEEAKAVIDNQSDAIDALNARITDVVKAVRESFALIDSLGKVVNENKVVLDGITNPPEEIVEEPDAGNE